MFKPKTILIVTLLAAALSFGSAVHAQTATNVICSGCVDGSDIKNRAVTKLKIEDSAVTNSKIKDRAVIQQKIAPDAVSTGKIQDAAVTSDKLAPNSVLSSKIKNRSVTRAKLATSLKASTYDGVFSAPTPNSSILLSSADAVVRQVMIFPPVDGHVIGTFQTWFTCTSGSACVARCSINPGGTTLDTSRFAITSVPSGQYQTMSVNFYFPVAQEQVLTVNAVCDMFTGVGSVGDPQLVGTFSATRYQ